MSNVSAPVVHIPFSLTAPGGGSFEDAFNFSEEEWAAFKPKEQKELLAGKHKLCMDRYNQWYRTTHDRPEPVVLTTAQERRQARSEARQRALDALQQAQEALLALDELDVEDDE